MLLSVVEDVVPVIISMSLTYSCRPIRSSLFLSALLTLAKQGAYCAFVTPMEIMTNKRVGNHQATATLVVLGCFPTVLFFVVAVVVAVVMTVDDLESDIMVLMQILLPLQSSLEGKFGYRCCSGGSGCSGCRAGV